MVSALLNLWLSFLAEVSVTSKLTGVFLAILRIFVIYCFKLTFLCLSTAFFIKEGLVVIPSAIPHS